MNMLAPFVALDAGEGRGESARQDDKGKGRLFALQQQKTQRTLLQHTAASEHPKHHTCGMDVDLWHMAELALHLLQDAPDVRPARRYIPVHAASLHFFIHASLHIAELTQQYTRRHSATPVMGLMSVPSTISGYQSCCVILASIQAGQLHT